jgi:phosphate:Na+ symporter
MSIQVVLNAAGGLALFLLAMLMMTEGLKVFAGNRLRHLLAQWTSTPVRGVFSGMLITGIVQSSSAVTVATIGFVNAGVLTMRQALGVIYGTNVGTTMTGWLVSISGFGFKIESFALPMLAVGVALRLASRSKRTRGLGEALAGFGLFFLGLAILKEAFAGLATAYGTSLQNGGGIAWPYFLIIGFVATLLTQSSSAAIAIILTAASGGVVGLRAAAAAVIGANVGTTSTAVLAVLKATQNAKRLAMGHVVFNAITGLAALALLPGMLWFVVRAADWLDIEGSPAAVLALFHTAFNVLGVIIMLPLTNRLVKIIERMFRSEEEDLGKPRHLDTTLAANPEFAVPALREELARLRTLVASIVRSAVSRPAGPEPAIGNRAGAVRSLGAAIAGFVASVRAEIMTPPVARDLAQALRIARYLDEAARMAPNAAALQSEEAHGITEKVRDVLHRTRAAAADCLTLAERPAAQHTDDGESASGLRSFEQLYQQAKSEILAAAVYRGLPVDSAQSLLDALSATRRMVEQVVKADRLLRNPGRSAAIEAEAEHTENGSFEPQPRSIASQKEIIHTSPEHGRLQKEESMEDRTNRANSKTASPIRYLYIALIVVLTAIVLLFKFQNLERVTVSFLSASVTLPLSVLVLLVYVLGMFTGGSFVALVRSLIRGATQKRPSAS